MDELKKSFIRLALENGVLQFGEFTLKSGRTSPYFFNAGLFYHGESLSCLGQIYAATLAQTSIEYEHLFGPAYKGLPLATATAIALAETGKNVTVTFNRKEAKAHGEGGQMIGAPLSGKTMIIDDVITAGTAFREAQQLINQHGGELSGVIIALDRCERGMGGKSTLEEIREQNIEVVSIINLYDLINYLSREGEQEQVKAILDYQDRYGCDVGN